MLVTTTNHFRSGQKRHIYSFDIKSDSYINNAKYLSIDKVNRNFTEQNLQFFHQSPLDMIHSSHHPNNIPTKKASKDAVNSKNNKSVSTTPNYFIR
uniref:Uncharacterized protein n=1 Tax=Strongyloides venezuelensis TaxID=75913 RepID=A0A0K0FPP7_STRVS